ncbi:unnamed protein product [Effrenium voratum]|nr:unnamed protein product [Effrenium voratum]
MNLGGVYFDLKHCLLVRLTYRKGDADDELIKPRTPQTARLKLKSQDKPRRTSRLEPESAGTHRRPQSGLGRQTSRSSRISTSSAIESKAESIQLSYANPGGEHGFTDPLPGMITEELVPGASSTGMAVLQGKAFPLYGWPCPCFEGPDKKEKEQLEPYVVETNDADVEDQDGKPAQHKPVSMRAAPLWLGTLPDHVPSYILRRTVAPQLQGVMDKTHFYRGNILELSHGSAYFMGPMGVTVAQTAAVQKQAAEFKLKIGIASVKGHAALVRVKESVEINKSNDLTKLLDSEDWVRVHLRMSWSFESNNKDGVYVGGDGPVKAFQELRKVAGWIDGGRAFVLPAFLIYEAHRVEAWVSPFFTSPVQTDVDPTASLKVVTKIVLTDFENLIRGDASRNVATVDVTLFFRCSEEVRIFPRGARLRLLSQEDVVFEERKDHLEKADPPRRVDSHLSDASFGKQETPDERKPRDRRVLPQHTATILDLSRARPGMYDIQLDGVKRTAFFDPRPGNYKLAGVFRYAQSQQLVIFAGEWMDAEVLSVSVGNLHELRIEDPSGQKRKQKVSLNELNHSPAKLKLALYDACAQRFNQDLWMRHSHIPDALSTRWIDVLALTFAVLPVASAEESAEDSESADDGSSSSAEASDSDLEGVKDESLEGHEQAWQKLLQDIAPLSSKVREAGAVQGRTVLVWGKPATGKSTLLHRLLLESLVTSGGGVVPLVLEAKEIVRVICPPGGYCAEGDVLDVLLQTRFEQNKASYKLLWQALYSRRVIIFVDGADENDAKSWEYLTHYLNLLSSIGHLIVLFARPLQNNLRWHVKSHLQPSSVYRLGLFSVPLQRLAACARLGAFSADDFQHTFQHCEAMRRQPAGQALLVSQAELRDSGRLVSSGQEEPCTHLLGQMAETAVPHLISLNLSACLPENAMAWVLQLLEVMAMKLYIDSAQLLLPETMTQVVEAEHAELEGSWSFVRALIQSKQFVLVEPCLPPFDKEKVSRSYMRFVPLVLRDYFLARCFTRYLREKRILGLPRPEDIMFATEWDLFFDLMIEMAAANKVMVSIDLSSKKGMTEEQFASFTRRLANLKTPVIQLDMPPNQVNLPPELERLMVAAQKSVNHLGLGCNALAEKGAALLSSLLLDCEVTFLQLRNCLLGPDGTNALVQAFLRVTRRRPSLKHAATTKLTLPGEAKLTLPGQELEAEQPSPPPSAGFKVSILDLSGNGLGSEGVQALVPVLEMRERDGGVLERLCLDENGLGPQGAMVLAKGLKKNSVLRGLSLSRNRLMDDGLEALAQALPGACGRRLRRLVLSSNELTGLAGQCLAESLTGKACAHLERLDLANNPLEAEGVRFLSELLQKGLPNLKELDLEYTYAGSDGAGHLADAIMAGIPLRRLELCGCRVGAEGAGKLAAALRHPQGCRLTRLGLRGNAIEDEGVTKIANGLLEVGLRCFEFERSQRASSNRSSFASNGPGTSASRRSTADKTPAFLTQLQELDVANNRIGLFGADALAAVLTGAAKTRLTSLDVSRNCLGRQGVAALAAGLDEGCPLQHLNVGSAKMGDGGAEAMAKALQKGPKSMVWLQIQENRIGQRGLELLIEAILKVPSLQRLAAGGNLAPDDWPDYLLNNLVCANRAGVTKPSVQLLSPSGRRWLGFRSVQRNTSFGTMDPRFATVLQLEQAKDGSRRVRRTSVLKQSAS